MLERRRSVWPMQEVLAVEFMYEDEDVVDTDGQDEERNDFRDDECDLDAE